MANPDTCQIISVHPLLTQHRPLPPFTLLWSTHQHAPTAPPPSRRSPAPLRHPPAPSRSYTNTAAVISRISYINGDEGILRYRGYPIEELAERSTFTEVAYLVLYGDLPTHDQLTAFNAAVSRHSALPVVVEEVIAALPHDCHPMACLLTGLTALSGCHPEQNPALAGQNVYRTQEVQDKQIVRLVGKVSAGKEELVGMRYMPHPAPGQAAAEYASSEQQQPQVAVPPLPGCGR